MADNVAITAGTGTDIATDDRSGVHYQKVDPRPRLVRVRVAPTISTSAYATRDSVGGEMEFTSMHEDTGGYVQIDAVMIEDRADNRAELDLLLFDQAIAGTATDNAAFDPTDADLANCVGIVTILSGHYSALNDNAIAFLETSIVAKCNATSIFGYIQTQSTPTYDSTADLAVTLIGRQL